MTKKLLINKTGTGTRGFSPEGSTGWLTDITGDAISEHVLRTTGERRLLLSPKSRRCSRIYIMADGFWLAEEKEICERLRGTWF